MTCEKCGGPYRIHTPWDEPPENHYYECFRCGHVVWLGIPDDEETR